jgi:triacylglycerol lipase
LAYAEKESIRAAVSNWLMDEPAFFDRVEAAQGFLAVAKDKRVAVLAFRGTEKKLEDWKTDAEFKLVKSPAGPGNTHEGFTNELDKVYADVATELGKRLGPQTLLYITGHSLGGGLATLMAARLVADKSRGVHAVHTFGSPRVGDTDFVKAYQLALGHCTYRIVNGEDLVTRVPPRVIPGTQWRYDHVGQIVYFDSDGRMQIDAGFWDRFVNTVIHAVADFRSTAKSALKDHSMEGYVRLMKNQARS